ncbi:MAG: aspartyl/asparaginyl beta-hydroxylase domain-containing protein [Blastocatellia bacterium]
MMPDCFKLPLSFDPERLKADLDHILTDDWLPHFNDRYYEGDWSGVPLRSVGGAATKLYPDPAAQEPFADTSILSRCPNLQRAIEEFKCPLNSVRLLRLGPGSRIREHRDYKLGLEDGEIGIHIPIVTNPKVEFFLNNERLVMNEGECWYLNLNLMHRVENASAVERIHLVLHCVVNPWVRSMIKSESAAQIEDSDSAPPIAAMSLSPQESFDRFCQLVLEDLALQKRLRKETNRDRFITSLMREGRARGYVFGVEEVDKALRASKRAWLQRWI